MTSAMCAQKVQAHQRCLHLSSGPDQATPHARQVLKMAAALSLRDNNWFGDAVGSFVAGASYLLGGAPGSHAGAGIKDDGRLRRRRHRRRDDKPDRQAAPAVGGEQLPNYVSSQVLSPSGSYHGIALAVLDSVQGHGLVCTCTARRDRGPNALAGVSAYQRLRRSAEVLQLG